MWIFFFQKFRPLKREKSIAAATPVCSRGVYIRRTPTPLSVRPRISAIALVSLPGHPRVIGSQVEILVRAGWPTMRDDAEDGEEKGVASRGASERTVKGKNTRNWKPPFRERERKKTWKRTKKKKKKMKGEEDREKDGNAR